jgi:translation initiation factor eIF-2B subunit alpha/methylthioribose-1-phosphate isomerase
MVVRGAPAIGAAAAYGMALDSDHIQESANLLGQTRPTAYDLFYAIEYMKMQMKKGVKPWDAATCYVEEIIDRCRRIGIHGEVLLKDGMRVLTHCNAGALATVDFGTALAPLRIAHKNGKQIFVFVDETRPRCQGYLTAWELQQEDIDHVVIADNAAGYYMKKEEIDLVIVGADRIARNGDFANKIGTYEKAVVAKENNIPFYVAAPLSTLDESIKNGDEIVIEERDRCELSEVGEHSVLPECFLVRNPAFDVTPNRFVSGFITENGIKTPPL